jgi:hypothetical protein
LAALTFNASRIVVRAGELDDGGAGRGAVHLRQRQAGFVQVDALRRFE